MPKTFPNVFAYFGQKNETEKIRAQMVCHTTGAMCATDLDGNPQAYFRLPVWTNKRVLGSLRSEGRLEHKPTLLLEAPRQ